MFIHQGCAWDGDLSGNKNYYEEHTCPTNLMDCREIIAKGEVDPHGVFELVEEHLITGENGKDEEEIFQGLIERALELSKQFQNDLE